MCSLPSNRKQEARSNLGGPSGEGMGDKAPFNLGTGYRRKCDKMF